MIFNLNDSLLVRLTPKGVAQYVKDFVLVGLGRTEAEAMDSLKRKAQESGQYRFQIWDFMNIYGPEMRMGFNNLMFERNEIEIIAS